jgi:hypothetical protein
MPGMGMGTGMGMGMTGMSMMGMCSLGMSGMRSQGMMGTSQLGMLGTSSLGMLGSRSSLGMLGTSSLGMLGMTGGGLGMLGSTSRGGMMTGGLGYGSSMSSGRSNTYTVQANFPYPQMAPARQQIQLQQVISRSSSLASRGEIRVGMEGPAVVLRGSVADESERRLAEALLRLEPGVRDVRNELQVREVTPPPRQLP